MEKTFRLNIFVLMILLNILFIHLGCRVDINVSRSEISVKQGETEIPNNTGYFNFGNIPLGFSQSITFTIENTGINNLLLTGEPLISLTGANETDFELDINHMDSTIQADDSTTFSINFNPAALGSKSTAVVIPNNDKNENPYTFVIVGTCTPPAPEIHVMQGSSDILCATGTFDFGFVNVNETSMPIIFTINNNGNKDLELDGYPDKISKSGTNASMFSIDQLATQDRIPVGSSTTFTISFGPKSAGIKVTKISILNNDSDENPYTFTITGTGIASPEINVKQGADNLPSGSGKHIFADTLVNESTEVSFTVENTGTATLRFTGSPKVEVSGVDAAMFFANSTSTDEFVGVGGSTTFTITFTPTDAGTRTATVSIANNDTDEDPYTFTIEGTGICSDINVKQDVTDIPCGSGKYIFADTLVTETTQPVTFTIENLGRATLRLTGSNNLIVIEGADKALFTADFTNTDTNITKGLSTTFTITFSPTDIGVKTATVSIANNDNDENPYTFTIEGKGVTSEINVKQGSDNIPNSTGEYYLVGGKVNGSTPEVVFTVENLGDGNLKLTGSPIIEFIGPNASEFEANTNSTSSSIAPKDNTTFNIKCKPVSRGLKTATVSIKNNDFDENPYTFTVYSFGVIYVEGDVNGDSIPDIVTGAQGSDVSGSNSGCAYIFFGKTSWNSSIDASNADVKLIGSNAVNNFGVSTSFAGDVNNDGFADIIVGANWNSDGGSKAGSAYIFLGRYNWASSVNASNADVKLIGNNRNDEFGLSVSKAGDVNNDGFADIIVGAATADVNGQNCGCAYIFFGSSNLSSVINASNADVKLVSSNKGDHFGISVSGSGDMNNDGFDDVIVGAVYDDDGGTNSGCAFVFFGKSNPSDILYSSQADVRIIGENICDQFGHCVSDAGDVNNDGYDDVIVGAINCNDGGSNSGNAYLFYGAQSLNNTIDASNADVKFIGEHEANHFGRWVSYGGDINKDGYKDIVVCASENDEGGDNAGSVYIFYGNSNLPKVLQASSANIKIIGEEQGDTCGVSAVNAGDINNDGFDDMVVGARNDDDGGIEAGCAYIFWGSANPSSKIDASNANVKLIGEEGGDFFGCSVSGGK